MRLRLDKKHREFLERLADGSSVRAACAELELGRTKLYARRNSCQQFRERWDGARQMYYDDLLDVAITKAKTEDLGQLIRLLLKLHPTLKDNADLEELHKKLEALEQAIATRGRLRAV